MSTTTGDPATMDLVLDDWLYLGSAAAARNETALQRAGITQIFTCLRIPTVWPNGITGYGSARFEDDEREELRDHIQHWVTWADYEHARGNRVLVHCQAGMSRSPALVLAYLMLRRDMTLGAAYAHLNERRGCICPNYGFRAQLEELQRRIDAREPPLDRHLIVSKCDGPLWLS